MKKIRLLRDIEAYMMTYRKGDIFEPDEPDQGFNDDGTFSICQGMGVYHTIEKNDFEIFDDNIKFYKWCVDGDVYCSRVVNTTACYYKNGDLYAEYQKFILKEFDTEISENEFKSLLENK